jgi:hypothetical protein
MTERIFVARAHWSERTIGTWGALMEVESKSSAGDTNLVSGQHLEEERKKEQIFQAYSNGGNKRIRGGMN